MWNDPTCHLCGEHHDDRCIVHQQPDIPKGKLRHDACICTDCASAINSASDDTQSCDWCGNQEGCSELIRVNHGWWADNDTLGIFCFECFNKARNEHPAEVDEDLKQIRKEVFGYSCADCGMSEEKHICEYDRELHIHHLDGNEQNINPDNLIPLCESCHSSK